MSMRHSAARETSDRERERFAADLRHALSQTPRRLPSRYLYDELGSALFDAITRLPWYRISRTEQRLLSVRGSEILAGVSPLARVIELGPGNGEKLATLLSHRANRKTSVHLIDVSAAALDWATMRLSRLPGVEVSAHRASYDRGLAALGREEHGVGRWLVLFLGSNIGNFDPAAGEALLRGIRGALADGDALLLGTDLVKPERELLLAYDDPLGVTAAFDRNVLVRANGELGADFDIGAFEHRAVWNAEASRVEMHLVSVRRQRVHVPAAGLALTLAAGESIWTESSYKYRADQVGELLGRAGFRARSQWQEDGFALTLAHAVSEAS